MLTQTLRCFKLKLLQKQYLDLLDDGRCNNGFVFFDFFLQSINIGIESLAQTQIFKPLEPDVVNL